MVDGCVICGTAVRCTCRGRGVAARHNVVDHEEHYEDGSEERVQAAKEE
jgi:hypothetical protein